MSHHELYQPLAAHLANTFRHLPYRQTTDSQGYRFIHTTIVVQIELYDTIHDREMHIRIRRLAKDPGQIGHQLMQAILLFCSNTNYFPIAREVTDRTRAFWENIAGFQQNPEYPVEYVHPAFDPFL